MVTLQTKHEIQDDFAFFNNIQYFEHEIARAYIEVATGGNGKGIIGIPSLTAITRALTDTISRQLAINIAEYDSHYDTLKFISVDTAKADRYKAEREIKRLIEAEGVFAVLPDDHQWVMTDVLSYLNFHCCLVVIDSWFTPSSVSYVLYRSTKGVW